MADDVTNQDKDDAQFAVDRLVAARVELGAAIKNFNDVRAAIQHRSAEALVFMNQYMDVSLPNPPPIAPDVAAPAPAVEPPVFTTVTDDVVASDNSSGGEADVHPALDDVTPEPAAESAPANDVAAQTQDADVQSAADAAPVDASPQSDAPAVGVADATGAGDAAAGEMTPSDDNTGEPG